MAKDKPRQASGNPMLSGLVTDRYRQIAEELASGKGVRGVKKKYGISTTTVSRAVKWWRDTGYSDLIKPETVPERLNLLVVAWEKICAQIEILETMQGKIITAGYVFDEATSQRDGTGAAPPSVIEKDAGEMSWKLVKRKQSMHNVVTGISHCIRWHVQEKIRIEELILAWQGKLPSHQAQNVQVEGVIHHIHDVTVMSDVDLERKIQRTLTLIPKLTAGDPA